MFLDTSILVEIARGSPGSSRFKAIEDIIGSEDVFISVIQLGELADWCHRTGSDTPRVIASTKRLASILPLTEEIALDASEIKAEMRSAGVAKFSLIDGIVAASARSMDETLLTMDSDQRKLDGAVLIR